MARATTPDKSERAFRTISEAAEIIGVPQHVLRFWETRFPQLQPLKRGGNRRYYRPADMALLESIRSMLHDRGLTIRGARLALAEGGDAARAVAPATIPPATVAPATIAVAATVAVAEPDIENDIVVEPDVAAVPIAAPVVAITPVRPGVDISALKAIRDRLRYALAA
jgi:DNA-binding transcriptional MerR regulator